jgi:hypothetical protein
MRNGLLAALTVLLACQGSGFAQESDNRPSPGTAEPPSVLDVDASARAEAAGFWGSGEYLLWWFKSGRVPPLATAGGSGVIGAPGTQVLVDNLNFDDDVRQGGRFALGYHFESAPFLAVEANYFFVADRQSDATFASGGDPLLAQPYVNAVTGQPAATLVAAPGVATGSVTVGAQTGLWGAEANLAASLVCSDTFHLSVLGGFRFLRLDDELNLGEQFHVSPAVPGFGGSSVVLQDDFRTVNTFYGGQIGLESGVRFGRLTLDFCGKIALGQMHQVADVNGATNVLSPSGAASVLQGGLFALGTNIGHYQRDELAFIPEVGVNLGWQLTRHVKAYAGYSFLWVNNVARAGEQIDPVVNVSQFPILSAGPLVGTPRPAFGFEGTSFWAQGLSLGLELRY